MRFLFGLMEALSIPLVILNFLGAVVSGIWLAVLGEWSAIGLGLLAFFVSTTALSFVLLPALLLSAPAVHCGEKGDTLGLIFWGALSNSYVIGVITAWCCGVLFLLIKDASSRSIVPLLIWSYGIATGPWAYMASKEQMSGDSPASTISAFLAQLAYVIIMLMVLFSRVTLGQAMKTFTSFMLFGLIVQIAMVYSIQREIKRKKILDSINGGE